MPIFKFQRVRMSWGLPLFIGPSLSGVPYVATDTWAGDSLDITPAAATPGFPIPVPLYSLTAQVAGVSKGDATTYVVAAPDVGQSLVVTQSSSNSKGFASANASAVTPVAAQYAWSQGLLGGNCSNAVYYGATQFLNNAGQCGRLPFFAYNTTSSDYAGGLDTGGWPTAAFTYEISAATAAGDGQLPNSTTLAAGYYQCAIRSVGQATTVSAFQQCTVSNITNVSPYTGINDGVTTYFRLAIAANQNPCLLFSGGIQYLDIPRDGVTLTYGGPEFWGVNLAHFAQESVLRLMDVCLPNGNTETVWSDRNTLTPEYGPTQPGPTYWSWERRARFIKAVAQYPGSRVQEVWINPPGQIDTTATQSNNYAYQLPTLLNSLLSGVSVQLVVEDSNEPWNGAFSQYTFNLNAVYKETQCFPYYQSTPSNISSIVGNGDGTVTVNTTSPLSAIPVPDGSTFAVTNGMGIVVNYQQGNAVWGAGSITPDPNYTVDGTVVTVPVTVLTTTSFKYTANGVPTGTLPAAGGSVQLAIFCNPGSTLLKDGTSINLYDIGNKVTVRRTYQMQQIWSVVRPQDRFILGLQQYGSSAPGAMTSNRMHFPYAKYIGGGSDAWYYGAAVAPYVKATGLVFSGVGTAGGTTITGVPWAATAVVGDQIRINAGGINAVAAISWASGTVTVQTAQPHGIGVSASVSGTMSGQSPAAYAGAYTCTGVDATHFTYPLASNPGTATTLGSFVGPGSANLTTTVVAGSSGTTLVIADTILNTVTSANSNIDYIAVPTASVTASIDGTTGVMTVTAGSGLMVGMMGNGAPLNLKPGTRISSQLTGTAGGAGTYQLNFPQAISSTTIAFAQTDGLVGALLGAVPSFAGTLASHIYMSMRWGKKPLVYEGGPDTQAFPAIQVAIHTNPTMQTVVTNLLDAWFNQGGQQFNFYWLAPGAFINGSTQGGWSALQSYTDTTSPKYAAIAGYATRALAYADSYGPGLVYGPSGSPGAYTEGSSQSKTGWNGFFATNGMLATAGSSADRSVEILRNIPRGRRYGIKVEGSDSASGTTADIYIDGTLKGTVTLAQNGNGTSGGTVPGHSTVLQLGELARGAHRVKVDFPIGRGSNVGLFGITLVKY